MIKPPVTLNLLFDALSTWAELSDKPTVHFIDEIDSLIGDSLLSVLRQIMAFLQRVINGGGTIQREYALDRKRVDLLVTWNQKKYVIELKIKYHENVLAKGLE